MVSPEKQAALDARMAKLRITEDDLVEKFVLGSGSGGQKMVYRGSPHVAMLAGNVGTQKPRTECPRLFAVGPRGFEPRTC